MVVANYVKTVNASFGNTVVDFSDRMVYVDAAADDAKEQVDFALQQVRKWFWLAASTTALSWLIGSIW